MRTLFRYADALKVLRTSSKQDEHFAYRNSFAVTTKLIIENEVLQLHLSKFSLKNSLNDGNKNCAIGGCGPIKAFYPRKSYHFLFASLIRMRTYLRLKWYHLYIVQSDINLKGTEKESGKLMLLHFFWRRLTKTFLRIHVLCRCIEKTTNKLMQNFDNKQNRKVYLTS